MLAHKLLPLAALGLNLVLLGSALLPGRKTHRNLVFAWLAAALAVWNLGVLGLRWTPDRGQAMAWEQFLHLGVIPIPALFYHYVLAFLDRPRRRADLAAAWILCAVFLALSPTPLFLAGVRETVWGWAPASGPLYGAFVAYFQIYLVLGLVRLVRAYRSLTSSFKRNRTLLVIVGGSVSVAGGLVDFVRFTVGWEWLYPLGIPANGVFALALGVAIVRYRLMDISALMKRTVLYLLASVAFAPVLLLGLWVVDQLFATSPGAPDAPGRIPDVARDALVLFAMLTIALPLLRRLQTALEHVMFRRRRGVSDALVALSKEMSSLLDVARLGTALTEGLVARIPVTHAILYLHDRATDTFVGWFDAAAVEREASSPEPPIDEAVALWLRMTRRTLIVEDAGFPSPAYARMRAALRRLERQRVALLVPLVMNGELRAVLALGEKLSGEIFDSGEVELLEMLIGQAAIALANSSLYEDLKAQMDELRRTQEQLVQSAKLAAIGELAASVAHEINNPLMVILGNSGLLAKHVAEGSFEAERAQAITTEANRAGRIVRDLLDFARRREPRREPADLHVLLDRAIELLHAKTAGAGVEVQRVYDRTLPLLSADRDQLTQVFVNLIANAVDAMPDGGTLVVQTEAREDDGRAVAAVSVLDTGVGIAPDRLPKIFEPFYTTKAEGAGTGLGLSVSQGIVKRHGGRIQADSKPGLGTTMVVTLPLG